MPQSRPKLDLSKFLSKQESLEIRDRAEKVAQSAKAEYDRRSLEGIEGDQFSQSELKLRFAAWDENVCQIFPDDRLRPDFYSNHISYTTLYTLACVGSLTI